MENIKKKARYTRKQDIQYLARRQDMHYLNKKARYAISSKKTRYIISKQESKKAQYNTIQYSNTIQYICAFSGQTNIGKGQNETILFLAQGHPS